jgi:hypothetical protein
MSEESLAAVLNRLEAGLSRIEAGQARLDAGQTRLEGSQTALRADLMERLDRLQTRFDQLHDECFVAFAQGETVRRHGDNTRAETRDLADQLSGLVRQVRMLRARIEQIEDKGNAP